MVLGVCPVLDGQCPSFLRPHTITTTSSPRRYQALAYPPMRDCVAMRCQMRVVTL